MCYTTGDTCEDMAAQRQGARSVSYGAAMPEMDQSLKRLIQACPEDWLRFLFPTAQVDYLGTAPTDVATEPQRILDTLGLGRYQGIECLVDIEAEAYTSPDIGRRLHEYAARAQILHKLPVISVVFWLLRDVPAPSSPYREQIANLPLYDQHFIGIEVYRLSAEQLLLLGEQGIVGLLPLIPFTVGGATLEAAETTGRVVRAHAPEELKATLITLLGIFAARNLGDEVGLALIRRLLMSNEILELSPLYRKWVQESVEEGRREGVEEGLREAVILLMRKQFGEPAPDELQVISTANVDTLNALLVALLTDTHEAFRQRLEL